MASKIAVMITGDLLHVSRAGVKQCMAHFGHVVHVHKPPACGNPIEDAAIVRFATDAQAEAAIKALKEGRVYIDGVGVTGQEDPNNGRIMNTGHTIDPKSNSALRVDARSLRDADAPGKGEGTLAVPGKGKGKNRFVRGISPRRDQRFDTESTSLRELFTGRRRSRSPRNDRNQVSRQDSRSRKRAPSQRYDDRTGARFERDWVCQLTTPQPTMRDLIMSEGSRRSSRGDDRDRRRDDRRRDGRRDGGRGGRERYSRKDRRRQEEEYEYSDEVCEDDGYGP